MEQSVPGDSKPIEHHSTDDYYLASEFSEELRAIKETDTLQLMFEESLTDQQVAARLADDYKSFFSLLSPVQKSMMIELTWRRTQL